MTATVRKIILSNITVNSTLAVVVGPWVWQRCQKIVNAALKAKAKAIGPEAKAKAIKNWPLGASRPSPGLEDYITGRCQWLWMTPYWTLNISEAVQTTDVQ